MKSNILFPLIVFLSSLALLLVGIDQTALNILDEGVVAYGAERVLGGEVPYRDFWGVYGPAQWWVVAALFKIFGPSLLVERIWDILVRAAIAMISYLTVSLLATKRLAVIAWLLTLGWLWVSGFYGYPLLPAALFTMLSAYFFIKVLLEPRYVSMLFVAGVFVGVTACFRHDIGFYVFFVEGISLAILHIVEKRKSSFDGMTTSLSVRRGFLFLCSGICLVALPVAVYLLYQVPLSDLWNQLIVFPATVYPAMRNLPYPSLVKFINAIPELFARGYSGLLYISNMLAFYFHFFVLAVSAVFVLRTGSGEMSERYDGRWKAIVFLTLLIAVLFLKSLVRPHQVHLIQVTVLSIVLSAVLLTSFEGSARRVAALLIGLLLAGMAAYPLLRASTDIGTAIAVMNSALAHEKGITEYAIRYWQEFATKGPERARHFRIAADQAQAIKFVQRHVAKNDKIFVGSGRHDITIYSDVMFYFLSGRRSGTKFHELHPGLTTTFDVQRQMVDELIANKVAYVVIYRGADNIREPNDSAKSSKVYLLDKFLSNEYTERARFGAYSIMAK